MRRRHRHVTRPPGSEIIRFRLAALFAAQFFDLGTFSLMVGRHGVAAEANPIVAQGFEIWGMPLVVVAKLALVLLVGSIVVVLGGRDPVRPTRLRLAALVTILAVAAGVAGGVSNVVAL